ncbi:MAG: 30S ribosomal protein S17 [Candidatus Magasanikbacteria bacterium GW2011_GWA2_40_10]|uniref:Small ribosomal subunit protein uS17 n=1 Tax=Candidatus Magasanikbacteria bacterium GW2011_GWA2_40_10 TaxID=1619037 RepID=A0A0G0Q4U5_9BACT|nr:MAG: 30S ribosomal protein S17 [Candidatus Magasanikbacteria bacterium GW2011_GWA2_40_10]
MQVNKRKFEGQVVSVAMKKTIVVRVDSLKVNSKYGKTYKVSNKYSVHDENGEAKMGDKVVFVESRPISKTKKWRLVEVVK